MLIFWCLLFLISRLTNLLTCFTMKASLSLSLPSNLKTYEYFIMESYWDSLHQILSQIIMDMTSVSSVVSSALLMKEWDTNKLWQWWKCIQVLYLCTILKYLDLNYFILQYATLNFNSTYWCFYRLKMLSTGQKHNIFLNGSINLAPPQPATTKM